MRLLRLLAFCLSLLLCPPAGAETLQARIEHVDSMAPAEMQEGQTFDPGILDTVQQTDRWVQIPAWLYGTWHRERMSKRGWLGISVGGMSKRDRRYGHRIDQYGRAWHHIRLPFRSVVETEEYIQYYLARSEEITAQDGRVYSRAVWTAWDTDKRTGKIVKCRQGDQIDEILPPDDYGRIKVYCRSKHFNQYGAYTDTAQTHWTETKRQGI